MKANSAGTLLDANPLFLKIVGYTRDDLKAGRLSWSALVPPDPDGKRYGGNPAGLSIVEVGDVRAALHAVATGSRR